MPWDHAHYETAFAVYLTAGSDDSPPPDAVFGSANDAEEYILREREKEATDRNTDASGSPLPFVLPSECYPEAGVFEVRNAFLPWWNDYRDVPSETPEPLPDYERNQLLAAADKYSTVEMVDLIRDLAGFVGERALRMLGDSKRKLLAEIAASKSPTLVMDDGN